MNREKMNRKMYVVVIMMVLPGVGVMQLPAEKYKLYGYSDFQFFHSVSGFGDKKAAFFTQNRTNILLSSEVFKRWDFFLNIEFNGAFKLQPGYDPKTKEKKTEMEGNLELEEAWAGYTVSPKLKFRAGVFHAPFGSFNDIQDASASYISV
ncbi:MAG: hypothetical protein GY950_14485, partial [bacterium]|nr:hypothetical protein [bacterium]